MTFSPPTVLCSTLGHPYIAAGPGATFLIPINYRSLWRFLTWRKSVFLFFFPLLLNKNYSHSAVSPVACCVYKKFFSASGGMSRNEEELNHNKYMVTDNALYIGRSYCVCTCVCVVKWWFHLCFTGYCSQLSQVKHVLFSLRKPGLGRKWLYLQCWGWARDQALQRTHGWQTLSSGPGEGSLWERLVLPVRQEPPGSHKSNRKCTKSSHTLIGWERDGQQRVREGKW